MITALHLVVALAGLTPEPARRLAVLEFRGSVAPEVLSVLADEARFGAVEALRGRNIFVMTTENMAAVMREMGRDLGRCTEGDCDVDTLRLIAADLGVTGEVTHVAPHLIIRMKLHDVVTGALLEGTSITAPDLPQAMAQVREGCSAMVRRRFSSTTPVTQPAQPAPPVRSSWQAVGARYSVTPTMVFDATTRRTWERSPSVVTYAEAEAHCQALRLGGYADWRLPTADELLSLVERGRSPAINADAFTGTTRRAVYWSSTRRIDYPAYRGVTYDYGRLYDLQPFADPLEGGHPTTAAVRCVR